MLRYLADAYRALRQTVPDDGQDRGADGPHRVARRAGPPGRLQPARRVGAADATPTTLAGRRWPRCGRSRPVTATPRAFRVLVRNAMFRRVDARRPAALRRTRRARRRRRLGRRRPGRTPRGATSTQYDEIGTGPDARGPALLIIDEAPGAGWSGRSSTTRPATTTGGSAPSSIWPPPTPRAPRSCTSPTWGSSERLASGATSRIRLSLAGDAATVSNPWGPKER